MVFGDRAPVARRYERLLATRGVEHGLIGPHEGPRLWTRHLLNCAALAEIIDDGDQVMDVGSGAGLPGIPLALALPNSRVSLVEPLERRVRFLLGVIAELDLQEQVSVLPIRAEAAGDLAAVADVVTARAVAPLSRLVPLLRPLAADGGRILAMKGAQASQEMTAARRTLAWNSIMVAQIRSLGAAYLEPPVTVVELVLAGR